MSKKAPPVGSPALATRLRGVGFATSAPDKLRTKPVVVPPNHAPDTLPVGLFPPKISTPTPFARTAKLVSVVNDWKDSHAICTLPPLSVINCVGPAEVFACSMLQSVKRRKLLL